MEEEAHGIVIVGGGICGLATALALHRCVHLLHVTVFPSILPFSIAQIVVLYSIFYDLRAPPPLQRYVQEKIN